MTVPCDHYPLAWLAQLASPALPASPTLGRLRRPSQLRSLSIHQNGFDESSLQAVLGSWRWHNHTLQRLELFVAEASSAGGRTHSAPASHEIVQKHGAAAGRLVEAAEQLEQRNRRLMHAIMRSELPVPLGECSGPSHDS